MKEVLIILLAYLIGSLPTSVWVSKYFFHIDIRDYGSGNAGATNTFRVLGKKWGTFVMIGDMLKGLIAVKLFLSSPVYAGLTIGAELILSILLILGLGGRIMIFIFFIFNIVLAYNYNFIWTPEGSTTINQQIAWGLLLMLLMLHGPGKMSIDYWLHKRHGHHLKIKKN